MINYKGGHIASNPQINTSTTDTGDPPWNGLCNLLPLQCNRSMQFVAFAMQSGVVGWCDGAG